MMIFFISGYMLMLELIYHEYLDQNAGIFLTFEKGYALRDQLIWTHYRLCA